MTALATLDDIEAVSRAVPAADETRVERLLDMVSAAVRRYTGLTFDVVADDEVIGYPVDGELWLPQWPITEATALQFDAEVTVEIGTSGQLYRVVTGVRRPWPRGPVEVTYTHGWATIPDDIVMVVAEVAAARWNSASTNPTQIAGSTSKDVAGYSESQSFRLPTESTEAWSAGHLAILDSYRPVKVGSVRLR